MCEVVDPGHGLDPQVYGDDHCLMEHTWTGTVPGEFFGVPGNGRQVTSRMIHVWEFRDGLISGDNV
jgi:predicted ester cyclase